VTSFVGTIGISKLLFLIKKDIFSCIFSQILIIKTLVTDPKPDPDHFKYRSRPGFTTTLVLWQSYKEDDIERRANCYCISVLKMCGKEENLACLSNSHTRMCLLVISSKEAFNCFVLFGYNPA